MPKKLNSKLTRQFDYSAGCWIAAVGMAKVVLKSRNCRDVDPLKREAALKAKEVVKYEPG